MRQFIYVYALAAKLRTQAGGCSVDASDACNTANKVSQIVLWLSATLYLIGFFSAYVLGPLLMRFDS